MDSAGLRTQMYEMAKNTVSPNIEIQFSSRRGALLRGVPAFFRRRGWLKKTNH